MDNKIKGKYGEDAAVRHLKKLGFEILERNYRHRRGEIDVIALMKNEFLVFVEVKLRSRLDFGEPENFVTNAQERMIIQTAEEYIYGINWQKDIRFDIIAVDPQGQVEHFVDAFY